MALSDPSGSIALPAGTLESKGLTVDLQALCELIRKEGVEQVVVGLPLLLDGRRGEQAENSSRFAEALAQASGLPVDLLDERLTSVEADHSLREAGARGKRKKRALDSAAATILLRTYLERPSDPPFSAEEGQ